jgi:steroid delta-isomerase-like uncharacterized protein
MATIGRSLTLEVHQIDGRFEIIRKATMSEQNKLIAYRLLDELWNRENFDVVDELVASDYNGHSSTVFHGPDGAMQFIPKIRNAFPDFQFTIEDQIAEEDRVATRWICRGTHQGEFQGIPPTGKQMSMTGITIFRIANGKLIDGWTNEDILGMLQQLGAIPVP